MESYLAFSYNRHKSNKNWGRCEFPHKIVDNLPGVNILANGPSLNFEIEEALSHRDRINSVCNFAAFSDYFLYVKPSVYFLADPGFFKENTTDERIGRLIKLLNTDVNWNLTIVVPINGYKLSLLNFTNPLLTIEPLPVVQYEGEDKVRMKLIRQGKSAPSFVNVTIFAEYYFLNKGYKNIYLYGVDHTFFDNMHIDKENQLVYDRTHFYAKETVVIKRYHDDGSLWKLSDWLRDKYLTFFEHERMQKYASYVGATIINCTKKSMIDAYPRLERNYE